MWWQGGVSPVVSSSLMLGSCRRQLPSSDLLELRKGHRGITFAVFFSWYELDLTSWVTIIHEYSLEGIMLNSLVLNSLKNWCTDHQRSWKPWRVLCQIERSKLNSIVAQEGIMLYSITNSFVLFYLVFTFRSWIITSEFDHTFYFEKENLITLTCSLIYILISS